MSAETIKENVRWMTADEVAVYLRVEEATVRQWVKLGKIPFGKAGSLTRFDRDEIDAWVRGRGAVTTESAA